MNISRFGILLPLALAAMLTACAAGNTLQKAGASTVFDMQLDSELDWARIHQQRTEVWTIDGVDLNALIVRSGVRPGEHVFLKNKEKKSRPDGPWYRTGMRADEIRDVILDAWRENGAVKLEATNLRPHRFGDVDGLRFDFTMTDAAGLHYRGTVGAAERNGTLTTLIWTAPAEYYYDRDVAAVTHMVDGMHFIR